MLSDIDCSQTVSIFRAVVVGAEGACIDLGMTSLMGGVALFVGCVVILRLLGARLLRWGLSAIRPGRAEASAEPGKAAGGGRRPLPYESPISSTGAWGRKAR